MVKGKRKVLISILAVIGVIAVFLAVWYFLPKNFLKGVSSADVISISVFDGNTGKSFTIDKQEEIRYIVENIQGKEMKKGGISLFHSGYSFRISFYGENGKKLDSFIINSSDTIRSDPFFYYCGDGLCYDYLKELENKYAK